MLASFPRLAGAEFVSLTTETFCRAFSAVFGAHVSKSVFGGTAVSDCLAGGSAFAAGASSQAARCRVASIAPRRLFKGKRQFGGVLIRFLREGADALLPMTQVGGTLG